MIKQKLTPKQIKELTQFITEHNNPATAICRAQAVLLQQQAISPAIIKQTTGYGRTHTFYLRSRYAREGLAVFTDHRQGDPKPLLNKQQRQQITNLLLTKTPAAVGYVGDGWTCGMLGDYIQRQYNVRYRSKTSYYLLFKAAKFTYHKPEKQYEKHDEAAVKKWRLRAKRRLRQAWRDPALTIFCGDEMVLSTQTTVQKVWLPTGQYPRIDVSQKRENRSVYGFLNVKTGQEHAWKTKRQNMYETAKVLSKLRQSCLGKKILLLWDSAPWHLGSQTAQWIKQDGQTEILSFPRYTPEENPQEHVWRTGRSVVTHNRFIADINAATDDFVRYLRKTKFPYRLLGFSPIS